MIPKLCSVPWCLEPEEIQSFCLEHAIEHADELIQPTTDELDAAEQSLQARLQKALAGERENPEAVNR